MAETGHTAGEYISHHLQNLTVCKKDGEWVWNECHGNFFAVKPAAEKSETMGAAQ